VSKVFSDAVGRGQHLTSLRGRRRSIAPRRRLGISLAERGAVSAVRRALLNGRHLDGMPAQKVSHAWPVTRDQLRLLGRQFEE
jgi:hypothetical protein